MNWIKFKKVIDKNPITVSLLIIVFFISSFFTILQGFSFVNNFYQNTFKWKEQEYIKINSIRPHMSQAKFNEVFGMPSYVRKNKKNLMEYLYKKRSYWIETISNDSGEVLFYAITSCDKNFKPEITPNPIRRTIVLQESTLKSVGSDANSLNYFLSGATANSYFFDWYDWGNPSLYESVYVGVNDVCFPFGENIKNPDIFFKPADYIYDPKNSEIDNFRRSTVINTYAESVSEASNLMDYFQIGVDRVQVRNALGHN